MSGGVGPLLKPPLPPPPPPSQDGSWSAPIAIGALGLSWGLQIGGAVCDVMIVLMKPEALRPFTEESGTQFKFGPESGVAVGPMGRMAGVSAHAMSYKDMDPAYTYTHAKVRNGFATVRGCALHSTTHPPLID